MNAEEREPDFEYEVEEDECEGFFTIMVRIVEIAIVVVAVCVIGLILWLLIYIPLQPPFNSPM